MQIVRANCRERLQDRDIEFIVSVMAATVRDRALLVRLLTDAEARDLILDEAALLKAIQDRPEWLSISSHLYFYLLARHCLRQHQIDDRGVADYVARLLADFASIDRVTRPLADDRVIADRIVDLLAALDGQNREGRFRIRAHIANYSLFLTGVFPARVEQRRQRRGMPGLAYYEGVGRASYQRASQLDLAGEYELRNVYEQLGRWFREVRLALNDLTERYLSMGAGDVNVLTTQ
ncbi:MAG: hypothetical protein O3A51_03410 [Verrucomicrobia bacterium]|nr:hypothetical protein [Verrucomicrobiota bacterium]